ncbi:MAG: type 2 lantipeptide synthetase LanM [Deltaproteobacteria bacterium]|nr:type 2 lantipeptide synthetase LanM [Deltaproteobacteria bacterium]
MRVDRDRFHEHLKLRRFRGTPSPVVGPVEKGQSPLPPWAGTFIRLSQFLRSSVPPRQPSWRASPSDVLPLENALGRLVHFAWCELDALAAHPILGAKVARDLERALLEDLACLFASPLSAERAVARRMGSLRDSPDDMARFVESTLGTPDGVMAFLHAYPVAARLCSTLINRWVSTTRALLSRLLADWSDLRATYSFSEKEPRIERIEWGTRPAVGGQPTVTVFFDSGRGLVYSPRSARSHIALARLVDWLSAHGSPLLPSAVRTLERGGYAWLERVKPTACYDPEELARFYERAGALLCLAYLLGATDLEGDSLIAQGEQLFAIRPQALLAPPRFDLALASFGHSVLSTSLVGAWRLIDGRFRDIAGLPTAEPGRIEVKSQWRGTHDLNVVFQTTWVSTRDHVPSLAGTWALAAQHEESIGTGFSALYQLVLRHRAQILESGGPLDAWFGEEVEVSVYDRVNARLRSFRSLSPRLLQDGVAWSMASELDSFRFLSPLHDDIEPLSALVAVDARAIRSLALPFLSARPDTTTLRAQHDQETPACIGGFFRSASAPTIRERLRSQSMEDSANQLRLLRVALQADPVATAHHAPVAGGQNLYLEEALKLAERLQRTAVSAPNGTPTWVAASQCPPHGRFQLLPMSPEGLSGQGGIALFLAAAGRVTGRRDLSELSLHALDSVREHVRADGGAKRALGYLSAGAVFGFGSIIYTLAVVGTLANRPELIDEAMALARFVAPELAQTDRNYDIYSGNAGFGLSLAALYRLTAARELLPHAQAIGRHLLSGRVSSVGGHKVWLSPGGQVPLGGFSHGAAGIAYALVRLFEMTRDAAFLEASREALYFEHELYSPQAGQWRDLRLSETSSSPGSHMCSWCHGAPGIALSRVFMRDAVDAPIVQTDLERAIKSTQAYGLDESDHLCCGNFGRIECMWVVAQALGRSDLEAWATTTAADRLSAVKTRGRFAVDWPGTYDSPTFFRGLSGIGYALLRLADPTLPSILALA